MKTICAHYGKCLLALGTVLLGVVSGCMLFRFHGDNRELLFSCAFESEAELLGLGGTIHQVEFVDGKVGKAMKVPAYTSAVDFYLPGGTLKPKGCVEFWGRLDEPKKRLSTCGNPRFFMIFDRDKSHAEFSNDWSTNNGSGGWGFTVRFDGGVCLATSHEIANGSTREGVLGRDKTGDWHHYAIVWNEDGIGALSNENKKIVAAVYLDGRFLMEWPSAKSPDGIMKHLTVNDTVLYFPCRLDEMPGYVRAGYSIDEFKIWAVDKTTFEGVDPDAK